MMSENARKAYLNYKKGSNSKYSTNFISKKEKKNEDLLFNSKMMQNALKFATSIIDKVENTKTQHPKFGGCVEINTFCNCGCKIVIESYFEGLFRCLECGIIRS